MALDTMKPAQREIDPARRTTQQLLAAAERDTDAVSIFAMGTNWADTERAIFVVKGAENIKYLRSVMLRQAMVSPGKAVVD